MKNNSKIIIETDDDNYPKNNFFKNLKIKNYFQLTDFFKQKLKFILGN